MSNTFREIYEECGKKKKKKKHSYIKPVAKDLDSSTLVNESLSTVPKTVKEYIKKVKPDDVFKKGNVRFDLQDGLYIEFSAVGNDDNGNRSLIGYRIEIHSRCIKIGMGEKLFYNWSSLYSEYYNLETKKLGKEFNKVFR